MKSLRLFALAVCMVALGSIAHAQDRSITTSWTSATTSDSALSLASRGGDVTVALTVTPTLSAGQLNFESSADNVTWVAARCVRGGVSATPEASFALASAASTVWSCPGSGLYLRVRLNPAISGGGTAAIRLVAGDTSILTLPLTSPDGAVFVRNYSPTLWTCTLANLANTLTQCVAPPAAGLRHYITDITVQTTTATSGQYAIQTGTGSNCGTSTAPLFPSSSTSDRWNAPTNASASDTKNFTSPLKPTTLHAICVIGTATNTITIQLQGYDAP
jgi:hypothetical protein